MDVKSEMYVEHAKQHYAKAVSLLKQDGDIDTILAYAAVGDLAARIASCYLVGEPQGRKEAIPPVVDGGDTDSRDLDDDEYDDDDEEDNPYVCGYCRAQFTYRRTLDAHVKQAHDHGGAPQRGKFVLPPKRAKLLVGDLAHIIIDLDRNVEVHREALDRSLLRASYLPKMQATNRQYAEAWAKRNGYRIVEEKELSPLKNIDVDDL